jgi:hypothetical protein
MQASTLRSRASILERQLGRVRSMQEATEQERDAAKAELQTLRERLRLLTDSDQATVSDRGLSGSGGEPESRRGGHWLGAKKVESRSLSPYDFAKVETVGGGDTSGKKEKDLNLLISSTVNASVGTNDSTNNESSCDKASEIQVLQEEIGALRKIRRRGLEISVETVGTMFIEYLKSNVSLEVKASG